MDNCGMPDQGPGLGGVCFTVRPDEVVHVSLTDATGRPVAGLIDICGSDDCSTAGTTFMQKPLCGAVTLDLASLTWAEHMWVNVGPSEGVTPAIAGGACAMPAPGTRGAATVDYLS